MQKNQPSIDKKINRSIDENVKYNNTSINNTNINNKVSKKVRSYDEILSNFSLSDRLTKTIMDFIQMRTIIKKPLTNRGLELMIEKLQKMSSEEENQIRILEQSIMNNWQGIFELKENTSKTIDKEQEEVYKRFLAKGD